ncbi:MAG: hypothetical protein H6R17_3138 [Proteobacteria bacterium]|nr:hypothetical protein [Pseudomonadota bacterium]
MAWELLLTSGMGLFSLFVIVFIVGMAVWFSRFYQRKMREDENAASARERRLQ